MSVVFQAVHRAGVEMPRSEVTRVSGTTGV